MIDPIGMPTPPLEPRAPNEMTERQKTLQSSAREFETVFLAEMLSHTSLADTSKSFGGGAGEDAFKSLLTREWAAQMTAKGGIGLAATIYQTLLAREGGDV